MILQQADLSSLIRDLPFDLNLLPDTAYLVGGAVRDALLNRKTTYLDLDFVLPENAITIAREISQRYQAGFVVLDRDRQIARVVFPQGTLDLAVQEGNNLTTDLLRRDFTINAIAYDLHAQQLIDPLGGIADLERCLLRMISLANLQDDPLRLLRAYRQAAQLNFAVESETKQAILTLTPLIKNVSAERIQAELNYLLANAAGNQWLQAAIADGLLQSYFPQTNSHQAAQLTLVESTAQTLMHTWHSWGISCPDWLTLAKLATLVAADPELAEKEMTNLKYSRAYIRAVVATVKHLPLLQTMTSLMDLRQQYFWFATVRDIFPILITRAIATGVNSQIINPLIERYLNPQDPVAHPQAIVSGNDLIKHLELQPSPQIGKLLTEIQIAYIESKIATPQEAIEWARSLID